MNIVRKLMSGRSSFEEGEDAHEENRRRSSSGGGESREDTLLGLSHLKKLISEGGHETKELIPLFITVAGPEPDLVLESLGSAFVRSLGESAAKSLVSSVRARASNRNTESASEAIANYLQVSSSEEEDNAGWPLLSALHILGRHQDESLVDTLNRSFLPSTLVKCIYLFFDLPLKEEVKDVEAQLTDKEIKRLLQRLMTQILLRLCSYMSVVEDLARKEDISLLFSAVTSSCPEHNVIWRKTASDILLAISRHSLSQPVISTLHNKGCIALCVENMHGSTDLKPLEIVEMFVTVFCFLKDSAETSQTLLEDFRTCQGYIFLSDFLLKLEQTLDTESNEAVRNLVLLVASLSFCGNAELKPNTSMMSHYQLSSFQLPEPENKGNTVKNINAFQVLQTVFLKSTSAQLGGTILDGISTVYTADNANFFLLGHQSTLPKCAEKIPHKPKIVQEKFFQLIELVIYHLKFVPCNELISISLLLKSSQNTESCNLALKTLLNLLKFDPLFKDVFREVGLLEVVVGGLRKYAGFISEKKEDLEEVISTYGDLGTLISTELLIGNSANAGVFKESGGCAVLLELFRMNDNCRFMALSIYRQLILSGGKDEDMNSLLENLHAQSTSLQAKIDILETIIGCMKESHRPRSSFRKVGGFNYVVSIIASVQGTLSSEAEAVSCVYRVLESIFTCITIAMRYEPANANLFESEIAFGYNLVNILRLLGCFSSASMSSISTCKRSDLREDLFENESLCKEFRLAFDHSSTSTLPIRIKSACIVLSMMYDTALGRTEVHHPQMVPGESIKTSSESSEEGSGEDEEKSLRKRVNHLNLVPLPPDPVIIHPGVISCILKLIPYMSYAEEENASERERELGFYLQFYISEKILKALLRSEKNQQIMSEVGFLTDILSIAKVPLEDETHFLHLSYQYLLERLGAQKLEPMDLRTFFRLGDPLSCCAGVSSMNTTSLPLNRIKTLVSMTTPRDSHIQNNSILPPFIEFDMISEGFGCLFLPSLAPMSPHSSSTASGASSSVVASFQQESSVIGGVGDGDRPFPPQPGLTYSTWICVDKFSDPKVDPHPVRLLTIARTYRNPAGEEENSVCISVILSSRDKALLVSTKETPLPTINSSSGNPYSSNLTKEQTPDSENGARIWFPDLIKEGEWHHLVLVFNRQTLKNPSFTLFINGQSVETQKMNYVNIYPGNQSNSVSYSSSVFGFVGTPPVWRRHSRLCWKQGPCLLFEDIASPYLASLLYKLGPHYLGSLQAPQISGDVMGSQVPEEKIIMGINSVAMSSMTLSKIKKVYSKMDNKSIAKQLGMATGENATPIRIAHNSGSHLNGPARSLGGVVIGYLGVRVFTPQPVSKVIQTVGGSNVLLGIIAMATDMESLYAGVKALACVLKSNPFARYEMEINKGYQILAMLLGRKKNLLNSTILHLVLTLAGTLDISSQRTTYDGSIPNVPAFKDVLCDLELWHEPPELEKSLYEHFLELVSDNRESISDNIRQLRDFSLVEKILRVLKKSKRNRISEETALNLIHALLSHAPRVTDVLCFALFTASTLSNDGHATEETESEEVLLRNRCLELFFSLLNGKDGNIHVKYAENVIHIIGFDWIQLFMLEHCHPLTVLWALKILMTLLSLPNLFTKFRLGTCNGHWLNKSDLVLQNKMVQALGPHSSTNKCKVTRLGIRQDIFAIPGFQLLNWLLPSHLAIPQMYYLISSLTVGQKLRPSIDNPESDFKKMDLDSLWLFNFGELATESTCERVVLNVDGICTSLCIIRHLLAQKDLPEWLSQHSTTLTQFLFFLYHNVSEAQKVFMTDDALTHCTESMFPLKGTEIPENEFLSVHPTKRNLMNFMRILIVDSLSIQSTPKNSPVLDVLLDAKPDNVSSSLHCRFQTELLGIVMDHLLAADVLIGGDSQFIGPNVFYLASRLADKLWTESLIKPPEEIFHFILKLISQAKRRSSAVFSLEGIYGSLNRCILFMLSREDLDRPEIRDLVGQVLSNRSLIFGAGNHELSFFGCLAHCLIQISGNKSISLAGSSSPESKSTWHVEIPRDSSSSESLLEREIRDDCSKIWEELYVTKKPALEEVFKISFGQQNITPSLESVRSQIQEPSLHVWNTYIDAESKGLYPRVPAWEFHTQLQSKLQRVTGGLTGGLKRLTSVSGPLSVVKSKQKPEEDPGSMSNYSPVEYSRLSWSVVQTSTYAHISVVKDVVDQHYKNRGQTEAHMLKFIEEEWVVSEGRLTQERGLWGPYNENCLTKWMMDMTEGPFRMRKKLVRNENFFYDYPYRETIISHEDPRRNAVSKQTIKYKKPMSRDSKIWHELHRPPRSHHEGGGEVEDYDDCDIIVGMEESLTIDEQMKRVGIYQGIKSVSLTESSSGEDNPSPTEESATPNSGCSIAGPLVQVPDEEESSDYQTVMRLLEDGEKISHMYRCARIQGLDTAEGLLLFGRDHFYILDGFTLVNGREVHDIEYIPDYEPIIPVVPGQVVVVSKREVFKVSYDNVKEVHIRRYLLQPIAIEVFSCDGQNKLLAFTKATRPKIYRRFLSAATSISDSASASVAGQKRSANVEQSTGIFSSMIGETSVTQRWVRGEITNFQYLMALNTLAGRSYNDLMQYPVFPWILANYKSEELDLTNPESFRDLSKPMGAQTPQRLEQFMKRYTEWEDPHTDSPPYHYGTHYSSAMIVSSYMVRCEPFTQHFLHLQGGHFDLPDRMFHSVEEAWDSASRNNMADVRELIPEFFYLSDFFSNHNHFELGTKQNGEVLDDVILPPWAKGSPEEFIRLHREALESDYVSSHLHEWIDLIFGYKQSGPPAMEATNVFHHLFYEGSVDIFAIEDPLQRNATIGFINNFGQIPKNLFKKPHPSKKIYDGSLVGNNSHSSSLGVFFHNLTNLRPSISPIKELKGPVGQIVHGERVYVVEHNKVLVPGNLNRYLAWGNNDQSFRLCNYESDKAIFICEPNYLIGQVLSCVMPNSKTVITAGTSSVIAVYEYLKKLRQLHIKKLLYGHTDAVTCLTASPSWNIAVSGSRDRTAIVWDLSRYAYVKHLVGHIGPIAAVAINELTGDIITTSGSWLYLWDINGRLQASVDTASKTLTTQILCVACSEFREWDRENVIITGSSDGVVRMWSLDYVEVPVSRENSPKKTVKPSKRRQSQSTTDSSEGGFVLLGGDESSKPPINDGYIWKKDLILRAKLTMHTAFERPDNGDPAAVTALAISKDHKIVYVGDEKGRVFSWTVSSRPGKEMVDHWWKDEGVESCVDCGVKFTIYERRHHCRNCGKVFCSSCSQYQAQIPKLKIMQPVRVCKPCHSLILIQ